MNKEKLGLLVSLLSGCSFATLAIFSKFAYGEGGNVPTVLFLRFIGATLIFWLYHRLRGIYLNYDAKTAIKLMLMGALGYSVMSFCFLMAVARISASLAGMLLYLYPAMVTVVTVLLKQEILTLKKALALVMTSIGLVMVLGVSFDKIDLLGVFFGIGSAVVYTTYIVTGSRILKELDPIISATYIMMGSALAYTLVGFLTGTLIFSFSIKAGLAIGGIILISTVLAVGAFWLGVNLIGPAKTSIISTVEPLVTVILAWLIFGEHLAALQLLGGLLIILGVAILQYSTIKQGQKPPCSPANHTGSEVIT